VQVGAEGGFLTGGFSLNSALGQPLATFSAAAHSATQHLHLCVGTLGYLGTRLFPTAWQVISGYPEGALEAEITYKKNLPPAGESTLLEVFQSVWLKMAYALGRQTARYDQTKKEE
jgi:hypothetical protein